jgi:hypothetical protein
MTDTISTELAFFKHFSKSACAKMRHYLLSSTCGIACQTDVIKHMYIGQSLVEGSVNGHTH